MRRINCVPVSELSPDEIRREHVALAKLLTWAWNHAERHDPPGPELRYNLGSWYDHRRFLAGRLTWVRRRWREVHASMAMRGLEPSYGLSYGDFTSALGDEWQGDWRPAPTDLALNRSRLVETADAH